MSVQKKENVLFFLEEDVLKKKEDGFGETRFLAISALPAYFNTHHLTKLVHFFFGGGGLNLPNLNLNNNEKLPKISV